MVGRFSELRGTSQKSCILVGNTSIDLRGQNFDGSDRNQTIPIVHTIGKNHNPPQYYKRKSLVKSAGGYLTGVE